MTTVPFGLRWSKADCKPGDSNCHPKGFNMIRSEILTKLFNNYEVTDISNGTIERLSAGSDGFCDVTYKLEGDLSRPWLGVYPSVSIELNDEGHFYIELV